MTNIDIHTGFKDDCLIITHSDTLIYDLGLEPWELSDILLYLDINGTNWSPKDLSVDAYKDYDEDGNKNYVALLQINTYGRNKQDFLDLAKIWEEAELAWEEDCYSI